MPFALIAAPAPESADCSAAVTLERASFAMGAIVRSAYLRPASPMGRPPARRRGATGPPPCPLGGGARRQPPCPRRPRRRSGRTQPCPPPCRSCRTRRRGPGGVRGVRTGEGMESGEGSRLERGGGPRALVRLSGRGGAFTRRGTGGDAHLAELGGVRRGGGGEGHGGGGGGLVGCEKTGDAGSGEGGEGQGRGAIARRDRSTAREKRRSFRLSRRDVPLEICARAVVSTALTATERLEVTLAPRTDALAPSARGAVIAEAMLGVRARGVRVRERVCGDDGGPRNVVQEQCQRGIREHPQRLDGNRRCRVERGGFGRDCAPVRFGGIFFLPWQSVLTKCRCEQKRTSAGQPARRGRGRKVIRVGSASSTVFRSLSYPQILTRLRRSDLGRSGARHSEGRFAFSGGDGPSVGRHHAR